jgi:hypothetical protein
MLAHASISGEPPAAGRNGDRDFHGEKRRNQTHASTTDPDARLYRKGPGQPAKLAYLGHVLMENRHALVVGTRLTLATGTAEREAMAVPKKSTQYSACPDFTGQLIGESAITALHFARQSLSFSAPC